jgi:hypothetical protein
MLYSFSNLSSLMNSRPPLLLGLSFAVGEEEQSDADWIDEDDSEKGEQTQGRVHPEEPRPLRVYVSVKKSDV